MYVLLAVLLLVDAALGAKDLKPKSYEPDLPPEHMAFFFNNFPHAAEACRKSRMCSHKMHLDRNACWGYEENCPSSHRYSLPSCPEDSNGWTTTKEEQINSFFVEGDFGYVKARKDEMKVLCEPEHPDDSFLECTDYTRFCRARNIMFDFSTLSDLPEPMRYREDVIRKGQVGGRCKLSKDGLRREGGHKSPLQSWYAELEHFTEFSFRPIKDGKCDIVVEKDTFIMKLDASVNMYHHFCDFLNLYASQHLNGSFDTDVNILIWDTVSYSSSFGITWNAFTKNPLMNLYDFKNKKVCFKKAVLPFLPRMIFGMYYNMPLVPGCYKSGLFHAFNRHILHRLKIDQDESTRGKIRITLLSRTTHYRLILNEKELLNAMEAVPDFIVKKVSFSSRIPFEEQLKITQNTDIFIGMHGAGLTHLLFLPDWAVLFELYNCEDDNCYKDLARLRGVHYITWRAREKLKPQDEGHHPTLGAHAKFTNYAFDVQEFMTLIFEASQHVKSHRMWKDHHGNDNRHTEL